MTRKEALKRISEANKKTVSEHGSLGDDVWANGFINCFEALGLIKFDPEPVRLLYFVSAEGPVSLPVRDVIRTLESCGYKVVISSPTES